MSSPVTKHVCWLEGFVVVCQLSQFWLPLQARLDLMEGPGSPPALWSAEEPSLYVLVLVLQSPDGSVIEAESTQVCCMCTTCFDLGRRLHCAGGP